jgi:hypothetical protein
MRRGQREAAAAGDWLQAAAAREKKVAAARERKGTGVGKEMAAAGAKRTAAGAAGAAKGMARELPASEGTASVFQSPEQILVPPPSPSFLQRLALVVV